MRAFVALVCLAAACGGDDSSGSSKTVYFSTDTASAETFFDFPWPSDLRLDAKGAPDMTGFPNPRNVPLLAALVSGVPERRGWPTMAAAYFRFTDALPQIGTGSGDVFGPLSSPAPGTAMLIDIDTASPELGTTYPIIVGAIPRDDYAPTNLVALAPRPGIVLRGKTKYAYVLMTAFAPGFSPPAGFVDAVDGALWPALAAAGVEKSDVLVATVFTTGDEVARTRARSEALRTAYHPTIDNLQLIAGNTHDGFCELHGTITFPQFQVGAQPFDTMGRFVLDGNDVPAKQGEMTVPLSITIPKTQMPAAGWPLYQFFHGSGGLSTGLVDLGHSPTPDDMPEPGKGPGYVVALHGIAAASAALPVNPERLPGASDYAYLNINNLAAFPFTFQQGAFEQRMFTDALSTLSIPQSVLAACGNTAPAGGAAHHFDTAKLVAGGQSMGGMYTNMIGAIEPRFGALVPTGAGGFWNLMILESKIIPGGRDLLGTALGIGDASLVFAHPAMNVIALSWEAAEPMVYMSRIAHRPLDTVPARSVYEPVGKGDTYFPTDVYDAAALAYQNQQVGPQIWPSMQLALATNGLDGEATYPVSANRDGLTRVVVQYEGDGIIDPHYLYRQNDAVKHQYGCFLESYLRDGVPTVPAPGGLTDACP